MVNAVERQVPLRYARTLVLGVEARGVARDRLLAGEPNAAAVACLADPDPDPDDRFPAAVFGRLYHRATVLLDDESLGLVSRGRVPCGAFRVLCHAMLDCEDLRAIVERAAAFMTICRGAALRPVAEVAARHVDIRMETLIEPGGAVPPEDGIVFEAAPAGGGDEFKERVAARRAARIRTTLYFWQNLLGWFVGRRLPLESVWLPIAAPDHADRWGRLFAAPVHFEASWTGFRCPPDVLALANVQHVASLGAFLRTAPLGLMLPDVRSLDIETRVLGVLADGTGVDWPTAAETARQLNLSVSSLHRQLRDSGASFQTIKDRARRDMATRLLSSSTLSLAEIGHRVGFDDRAAFARAFRRWTGTTPGAYRGAG